MQRGERKRSRLSHLIAAAVDRLELDLTGQCVLTEAATGPYVVTPVIAALAGADVIAFTKDTRHGTVSQVRAETAELSRDMGVEERIEIVEHLTDEQLARADIVTNCGHLRPLDGSLISRMRPGAVILLMYESWEYRPDDVDLEACRQRGIKVAGTNERHPKLRIFDYLGMAALYGLLQCGVPVTFSRLLLICDHRFAPYVAKTLLACGGHLEIITNGELPPDFCRHCRAEDMPASYDAVIVADPGPRPVIGRRGDAKYGVDQIGEFNVLVQIYGDVDRSCLDGVTCYPPVAPARGHMGINLCELGPDPVVRLQAGSLKVGEVLTSLGPVTPDLMEYGELLTPC